MRLEIIEELLNWSPSPGGYHWKRCTCHPCIVFFRGRHRLSSLLYLSALLIAFSLCVYLLRPMRRPFFTRSGGQATTVSKHLLCVLVPFRDCDYELTVFAPYISDFLKDQNVDHRIIVLNQIDQLRFNRASLINVGWFEADRIGCDYMVMHDVDLLPLNRQLNYSYPERGVVRHISSPQYHPQYDYAKFVGGILILTMEDFKQLNGMSNNYWGWGLEDDEFYLRLRDAELLANLERPQNLTTSRKNTFLHIHDTRVRKRDRLKIGNQAAFTRRRDRAGGLNSVKYHIAKRSLRKFRGDKGPTVQIMDIELECDTKRTPYCESK